MGPLHGLRVIELAGIGPGPFCGMMLSDMGAEVVRVDRVGNAGARPRDVLARNRRSIAVDLKQPEGVEVVLKLCETADGLFEGFRPGVTERLGLGPEDCMARNERLVYGRMTGWGQEGPLAHAFGLVCGLLEAQRSGKGQVIDAAMVDGAAALMAMFFSMGDRFNDRRGTNLLDTGSHFYNTYETKDGEHVCVGAIEPQFYQLLVEKSGVDANRFGPQMDAGQWGDFKDELTEVFKTRTRDEWCEIMEGTDICFAPVLSIFEAPEHPHNKHRDTFVDVEGIVQPAPAPRFSRTVPEISHGARIPGEDSSAVLADAGFSAEDIEALREKSVIPAA